MGSRQLKSVNNFVSSTGRINNFVQSINTSVYVTTQLINWLDRRVKAKSDPKYQKFKPYLEFDKYKKNYIFELGFLAQFANLEYFEYEILKELHLKYPSSLKTDKLITFDEISGFKSSSAIKEYFADRLSIEHSYEIEDWALYLEQKFRLNVFKNKKLKELAMYLNIVRNAVMHGGKKVNSKIAKDLKKYFKVDSKLGENMSFDKRYYKWLFVLSDEIVRNICRQKRAKLS